MYYYSKALAITPIIKLAYKIYVLTHYTKGTCKACKYVLCSINFSVHLCNNPI